MPDPPKCAPAAEVYILDSSLGDKNSQLCPPFLPNNPFYLIDYRQSKCEPGPTDILDIPGHAIARVAPNTDVSAECASENALKYCKDTYCPTSCKVDRKIDGPFYCSLDNIGDKNSKINDGNRCPSCAVNSGDNTKGAQCQVMLLPADNKAKEVYLPAGCDAGACAIGDVNSMGLITGGLRVKPTDSTCNGFCFPRLIVPSCGDYTSAQGETTTATGLPMYNRAFGNCQSCPVSCRYDYKGGVQPANRQICGDGFKTAEKPCGECTYAFDTATPTKATCEDANHYNDCTTPTKYKENGQWWFRSVDDIVRYDTTCTDNTPTPTTDCTVYRARWASRGYTYVNGPIYKCEPAHKYPELDKQLGTYRECGTFDLTTNPNRNLCAHSKDTTGAICNSGSCFATYDAREVACQQLVDTAKNPPSFEPNQCLLCPTFCRIDIGSSGIKVCQPRDYRGAGIQWDRGGNQPQCDGGKCTDPRAVDFPPGYCGVDISKFNIVKQGEPGCQPPNEGYGIGCPARCRILIGSDQNTWPTACGAYYEACTAENLPIYCRTGTPNRLCTGCLDCQTDCLAKAKGAPDGQGYVRQNCNELCLDSDYANGARTDVSAKDLVSAMGGAAGKTSWRNLGIEGVAVFILPILCILITLAFIRVLSPILGGDIELPGVLKLI
ncbi:Uncharacterised protein [uncultured archaeon]|nr:Uncharacterised protein [uncultured archaeon]